MKNKSPKHTFLVIGIVLLIMITVGTTYAYLVHNANIRDGNIDTNTTCFIIDYDITNDTDSTGSSDSDGKTISGTLFPSQNHLGGLYGKIKINVNASCGGITGKGTLYLHINDATSSELLKPVPAHCENKELETLSDKTTSAECNENNNWITNGTGIKYAVTEIIGDNIKNINAGYIKSNDIGTDIPIITNFNVDTNIRNYYVYVWMDGNITDNSYNNLPFSAYIHTSIIQD